MVLAAETEPAKVASLLSARVNASANVPSFRTPNTNFAERLAVVEKSSVATDEIYDPATLLAGAK